MHRLPAITAKGNQRRLPLADATLLKLAERVLAEATTEREELLESALLSDPVFALWCVARALRESCAIESTLDCARWLSDDHLFEIGNEIDNSSEDAEYWVPCLRESFALRLAAGESPLVAMLSNASRWFEAIGDTSLKLPRRFAVQRDITPIPTDSSSDPDGLVSAWRTGYPGAASVFRRALAMREKLRDFEQHWDQKLLHEKLASLKEFTYGASHELNNPLFNISSRAQVLLRDEEDPERRRKLSTIYAHAMRASEMINDIASAARPPKPAFEKVDLSILVADVVEELTPAADEQATRLTFRNAESSKIVDGDREQIALAVREVVVNALEGLKRSTRRGEVDIALGSAGDFAEIVVSDNGPGMDDRARRHMFDPFFSGYESGRGLGFGLTKSWQIVQSHGGVIVVDSQPQRGTTCTIRLRKIQSADPARHEQSRG